MGVHVKNLDMMMSALEYIESHIENEVEVDDVAEACYCSASALQKTFRYVFHCSVKEYIIRRRLSCAAKALVTGDSKNILEVAVRFGYSSSEAFSRAFKKFWGVSPSEFKRTRRFSQHTPKLAVPVSLKENGGIQMRTRYDITQLYELLQERKNCCYICADIHHLHEVNQKLGRAAGDQMIMEAMRRLEAVCSDDDILFRIGGDEFVIFTNTQDMEYAQGLAEKVLAHNGEETAYEGGSVAVSLYAGAFQSQYQRHVNYDQLFSDLAGKIAEIHRA